MLPSNYEVPNKRLFTIVYFNERVITCNIYVIFITKYSNFISNLNDDCSQLSFEVYNVCVAQKLQISEFLIELFFAWTLATSVTSQGRNYNLSNLNRVSNFC